MWSHDELSTAELVAIAGELDPAGCECRSPKLTGTRHGYTCSPHRAIAELEHRNREASRLEHAAQLSR